MILDHGVSNTSISATPVLNDVKDITLARNTRNGLVALVSYEDKVRIVIEDIAGFVIYPTKAPPQLWKLETVKDVARLTLRYVGPHRPPRK